MEQTNTPIQLVALDLDGTLVNEALEITPPTQALLRHLIQNTDVRVVLATGRMFPSAEIFGTLLGVTDPIVAYQGAMIRDVTEGNPMLYHQPLDLDVAKDILTYLNTHECHINLYIDDVVYTASNGHFSQFYAKTAGVQPVFTEDLHSLLNTGPTKFLVVDEDGSITDTIEAGVKANYPETVVSSCKSRYNFCEIIHGQASKWNAVSYLANQWGIPPQAIMAIGDQGNDVSMIKGAGIGVAMGNAPDYVKAHADFVTGTIDEDGVVEALEKFVLRSSPQQPLGKPTYV